MATSVLQRNFPFFQEQFCAAVAKSSVVVKFIACTVTFGYMLSFASTLIPYMTVTPGYVMPPNFMIQAYALHCFIEFHFWEVLADIIVVIVCGKLLEPLWGAMEMLLFFVVVNTGVALLACTVYFVLYFVTKNDAYLFETHIHGLAGFIAGFTVAVKQIMPEYVLLSTPLGKLRNTHIPLIMLVMVMLLRVLRAVDGPYPIMYGCGIIVSWMYLRFYQKHSNGHRGDMADGFSLASFFPSLIQPVVSLLSNMVFSSLVVIKLCDKPQRKYDVSSPGTITVTLPGTERHDAERRRLLALKALNERLSKSEATTKWPSLDENDKSPTTSDPGEVSFPKEVVVVETRSEVAAPPSQEARS